MSKLLELLLLDEINGSFKPSGLQFGFLNHRGTREASILVHETAERHLAQKTPLFVANLDARKCFDRLWHSGVLFRARDHLTRRSWALLASWYANLTARVRFGGSDSDTFFVRRGVRQGALLSPCLTNVFLLPLVQELDDSGLGARVNGHHVPVVAYADDLLVVSSSTRDLQGMLDIVTRFAVKWRLEFVHPEACKTKSHCFVFGSGLLAQLPEWYLCEQKLLYRDETEHLGIQYSSQLLGSNHVSSRIRRARGAFFGLMPAGMFNPNLSADGKAFLWRTVVSPALTFGCSLCFLKCSDVRRLNSWQATSIKHALRLPRTAHHTALLSALRIPSVHDVLRRDVFNAFRDSFRREHRLRSVLVSSLTRVALCAEPLESTGPLAGFLLTLCGGDMERLLQVAGGYISHEWVTAPTLQCGLADSLRWLLERNDATAWGLVRLLVSLEVAPDPEPV